MGSAVCCPLYGDDGEGPSFYSTTRPRAGKEHRCCECGETIAKGTVHELCSGKWDGSFGSYRTCLSCVEIRDHFACSSGWYFTCVWEQLEANFFPTMKAGGPCMEGLSPAAKARLFERRSKWFEELTPRQRARVIEAAAAPPPEPPPPRLRDTLMEFEDG